MANTETQVSLDIAEACNYLENANHEGLLKKSEEVGRVLNHMIENPEKYAPKKK